MDSRTDRRLLRSGVSSTRAPINDKEIRDNNLAKISSIIFPDQSANQILNGHRKGTMPDEYTGGVGKEGVENLKKFVENGGTLVFLNRASNFAIEADLISSPRFHSFVYSAACKSPAPATW